MYDLQLGKLTSFHIVKAGQTMGSRPGDRGHRGLSWCLALGVFRVVGES